MKRGKRYNIVKRNVAVGLLLGMLNSMLFADIKVDKNVPQKTSVDRAQNGANIININTPNTFYCFWICSKRENIIKSIN